MNPAQNLSDRRFEHGGAEPSLSLQDGGAARLLGEFGLGIFERLSDAVYWIRSDGRFVYANPAACRLDGYSLEDMRTKKVADLDPDFGDEAWVAHWKELKRVGSMRFEAGHLNREGSRVPVEVQANLLSIDGQDYVCAILRDISDRRADQERVGRLNRELQALRECSQAVVRAKDETSLLKEVCGIIHVVAGYRMAWVGLAEKQAPWRVVPAGWSGVEEGYLHGLEIHWRDGEGMHGPAGISIREGRTVVVDDFARDEIVAIWRERALLRGYRSVIAMPLLERGKAFGTLLIYAALPSAFTPSEIQLLEGLADDLAFGILSLRARGEREAAEVLLVEMLGQAQAAAKAKSEFLANMSHEIRTPMNAILGLAHLAREREENPKVQEFLDKIQTSGRLLLGIINDILDFSKIDSGKLELEARNFDLEELLTSVRTVVGTAAQLAGLEFGIEVAPDVPARLRGDPLRLIQVLVNLGNNAIKFTPCGRVRIALSLVSRNGRDVVLGVRVEDTGIGVEADRIAGLFEPFVQADASTTRRYGGTGLGLSICNRLVEQMGGTLQMESEPGVGSVFRFTVDLQEPDSAKASEFPDLGEPKDLFSRLQGRRVLLVEDNEFNRLVAGEILRDEAGMDVVECCDGASAVRWILEGNVCDAILMDIQMPGMDGYEATAKIRERFAAQDLPIIAMTAHAMESDREHCLAGGMVDHVSKPFDPAELFRVLGRWIGSQT